MTTVREMNRLLGEMIDFMAEVHRAGSEATNTMAGEMQL